MRGLAALVFALAAPALHAAGAPPDPKPDREVRKEQREATAQLPEKYRQWLLEVDPILTAAERAAFLALSKDYQRDAFIERFWQARDPRALPGHNAYRDRWQAKVAEAKERFKGDLQDERARLFLLNGPPDDAFVPSCPLLLVPIEVWYYQRTDLVSEQLILVFYRKWGGTPFRLWDPRDGPDVLYAEGVGQQTGSGPILGAGPRSAGEKAGSTMPVGGGAVRPSITDPVSGCPDPEQAMKLAAALRWVASQGMHWDILEARFRTPPPVLRSEWVSTFKSYSTDLPQGAAALSAQLVLDFPGRRLSRTVVQGVITVAAGGAEGALESRLGEHRSYDLLLTGEVLREGVLFDSFRYKFDFPAGETKLPLVFQRWLRPGDYTLVLRVEDLRSGRQFRVQQQLAVPQLDREAPTPAPAAAAMDPESARLFAEAAVASGSVSAGDPMIRIVRPHGDMQTGLQRFDTLLAGAGIASVTFTLDGKPVLTKRSPPFSVELDLGPVPHARTLAVTAFAADGSELARDELTLNAAGHRFRVHLVEPQRGKRYAGSLVARAEVETPEDGALEKVEIYLDETRIATLFQAPWVQPVSLPSQAPAYVRAVAWLADGSSTEDLVFVNAPDNLEEMDVDAVELYATVLGRDGRPVGGLAAGDFTVLEDGKRQDIVRFERVSDLPIHALVALDMSASMEGSLDRAREAALRFLETTIRPKDRAAVVPFNDHPTLAVKFTHDLGALAGGLAGLKAERGTALYDTLFFCLYYFNGVKGQRAILLLSDGKDEGSRSTWEDTLEFARRAGVTIYTIGLGDQVEKKKLARLAEETGGRAFFLDDASRLAEIYAQIEDELRSRYLIVYQSSHPRGSTAFRTVDLQVNRKGLEAKTIRGYYP